MLNFFFAVILLALSWLPSAGAILWFAPKCFGSSEDAITSIHGHLIFNAFFVQTLLMTSF